MTSIDRKFETALQGLTAVVAACVLTVACSAAADAQILAQASPVRINLTARPNQPLHRDVQISNLGDQPVFVHVRLSDWQLSEDGALSLAPAGSTDASLQGQVSFDPAEFTLAPNQTRSLDVTLTLAATGPATRWGVLLSEVRPASRATSDAAAAAGTDLGTTIYLSRIPADQIHAEETSLTVTPLGGDSLLVEAGIHNSGERHAMVSGTFTLMDSSGTALETGPSGTGVVLPGSNRVFSWICMAPDHTGHYRVSGSFDDGAEHAMRREAAFTVPLPGASAVATSESH